MHLQSICCKCGAPVDTRRSFCNKCNKRSACCSIEQLLCSTSQLASTRTKLTAEQSAQLDASLDTLQKVLSDNRVAPFLTAGDYKHGLWSHVRPQLCRYETLLPFSCQGSEGQNKVVNQDRARNDMRGGCGVSRTGGLYRRQRTKQCNELVLSGFEDS